ncbi:MAG: ABC transporter substrate-binding protein, partial [Chloroflexi bacterium]|nr:ABC transporter substrate-binding protein [Chloroflexota bacterium]
DGSEWNAEVARWNLDRLLTHPKSLSRAVLGAIKSVDVVDASTIKVNLSSPDAALPVLLTRGAATGSAMISKAAVEKLGDDGFAAKGVGTGPMELVLWRRDDQLVLKKWDGYWEKGADGKTLPYLDGYIERYVADPAAALVEVKTGNAHLIDNVRAEDVAGVKADPKLVYWELGWAGPAYFFAGLDATKGPFQNPKLRQAALYAVDREALAKALGQGLARPDYYPFWQPALLGYDEALPSYKYDLAKAKQLVSESGYNNSVEITMSTIAGQPEQRIGELVQEMWGRAGMRVRLDAMEGLAFYTRAATGSFDAGFIREPTLAVDPDLLAERMTKGSVANVFNYNNPALDSCMMEGRGEYDAAKRSEIYKRCQRVIYEDATISSGYRIPENRVFSKAMKGLSLQFLSDDLRGVWLEDR